MRLLPTVILLASSGAAWAQPAPDPANGLILAEKLCRGCHLVSPRQAGPVPDGIPSFMAIAARPGIDSRQVEAVLITPTHPQMPNPPLDARQMRDVVAYILSLAP